MKAFWVVVLAGMFWVTGVEAEERINLWPMMYKQGDTLHVLGPIVKVAPDNVAVRPLIAVNTQNDLRLRVLYPLAELNAGPASSWIFSFFWGEHHRVVFPFFHYSTGPDRMRFVSLPWSYGYDEASREKWIASFPFFYQATREDGQTDVWAAAGVFRHRFGAESEAARSHLLPLYFRDGQRALYTPVYGYRRDAATTATYFATPLAGRYRGEYEGHWVWPFYRKRVHFPLWSHTLNDRPSRGTLHSRSWVLGGLYHKQAIVTPDQEQVRHRLLWKAWDYRRRNEQVQVDAFPFVTYDRKGEKTRSLSFLWRVFRYERNDERRELDVLFLPVHRSR